MMSVFKKLKYIEKKKGKGQVKKKRTKQCLSMSTLGTMFSASS